jgi:hypothetical protein
VILVAVSGERGVGSKAVLGSSFYLRERGFFVLLLSTAVLVLVLVLVVVLVAWWLHRLGGWFVVPEFKEETYGRWAGGVGDPRPAQASRPP